MCPRGKEHLQQERERAVLFIFMNAYDQCSKTQFVLHHRMRCDHRQTRRFQIL